MITLLTPSDCIKQIVEGYNIVQKGYGLADDAIVAYLQMEGCNVSTLHSDLQVAGCEISKKTLQNRQSMLRGQGKLAEPDERYRRDGNGGGSRAGNGAQVETFPSGRPKPPWPSEDLADPFDALEPEARIKAEMMLSFLLRRQEVERQFPLVRQLLDEVKDAGGDCKQPGSMDLKRWTFIYQFVNPWADEMDRLADFEENVLPTLD